MKTKIASALILLCHLGAHAGEVVLPYSAFGPQDLAREVIGMEWWQWDAHGDSRPREYPIKVVVYWDRSKEEIARKYPPNRQKLEDFRYVEYSVAVAHMGKVIKEFTDAKLDSSSIEKSLNLLKFKKQAERNSTRNAPSHLEGETPPR